MANWWSEIWGAVVHEFSDLPDTAQVTRIIVRLSVAILLGGILGYEREEKGKAAGIRTHMLVALGAAIFVAVPLQSGIALSDMSRILQGLLAGIGFIGAGCIMHREHATHVRGLTTAAGIWVTAAIGVTVGLGREMSAIIATLMALVILTLVPKIPGNGATSSGKASPAKVDESLTNP